MIAELVVAAIMIFCVAWFFVFLLIPVKIRQFIFEDEEYYRQAEEEMSQEYMWKS